MQATVSLRKKRTVPEMVSEIFNYLKIHILNLFKALAIFVGPFYIVGGIFVGSFYGNMFSMIETAGEPDLSSMISIFPGMLCLLAGGILFQAVIVGYMKLSLTHDKADITLALLGNHIKKYFWNYLGANFLVGAGITVAVILVGVTISLVLPVLGVLVMMFGMFYIMIAVSLFAMPIGVEDASIIKAITRSFQLIKGNWWRSLGYYLLVSIIQSFMASIAMMPVYIIGFYKTFSSAIVDGTVPDMAQIGVIFSIVMPIMMFINLFFYTFTGVGIGINYFSLVEQKEEVGLTEQIELMNPDNNEIAE